MNEFWFKPKIYGYGGAPVTWEGWMVVAVYVAIVLLVVLAFHRKAFRSWRAPTAMIAASTVALICLTWLKTDGQWAWRWGGGEIAAMQDNAG